MTISIIVCTRNRAESLRATLESIKMATVPTGWEVELLVVDNGSSDHTQETVLRFKHRYPQARYHSETKVGVCHARNTGLRETSGDTILFTDDDIRVPVDWIEGMCRPIIEGRADAVQGGIKIAQHLERPWLKGALRIWVAAVEDPVHPPEGLVGANMAFSREAFQIAGGFNPLLGGGASGFYEDTYFGWVLKRAGIRVAYLPAVAVEHHFDPERLTLRGYLKIARQMAASRVIVTRMSEPGYIQPSIMTLFREIPGFALRIITQSLRSAMNRGPDPGFVVRYYYVLLWFALRKSKP